MDFLTSPKSERLTSEKLKGLTSSGEKTGHSVAWTGISVVTGGFRVGAGAGGDFVDTVWVEGLAVEGGGSLVDTGWVEGLAVVGGDSLVDAGWVEGMAVEGGDSLVDAGWVEALTGKGDGNLVDAGWVEGLAVEGVGGFGSTVPHQMKNYGYGLNLIWRLVILG